MKYVIIDAARGGDDFGYRGNYIIEKNFTLALSKAIYEKLKNAGVEVFLTRNSDITLSPTERTKLILNQYGNNSNVILLSNQIISNANDTTEIIYALRNSNELANLIQTELENSNVPVGKVYQLRWPTDTSKDYYAIQRDTGNIESILIDYKIADTNDWENQIKALANAVSNALLDYIGVPSEEGFYTVVSGDSNFMGNNEEYKII